MNTQPRSKRRAPKRTQVYPSEVLNEHPAAKAHPPTAHPNPNVATAHPPRSAIFPTRVVAQSRGTESWHTSHPVVSLP